MAAADIIAKGSKTVMPKSRGKPLVAAMLSQRETPVMQYSMVFSSLFIAKRVAEMPRIPRSIMR